MAAAVVVVANGSCGVGDDDDGGGGGDGSGVGGGLLMVMVAAIFYFVCLCGAIWNNFLWGLSFVNLDAQNPLDLDVCPISHSSKEELIWKRLQLKNVEYLTAVSRLPSHTVVFIPLVRREAIPM